MKLKGQVLAEITVVLIIIAGLILAIKIGIKGSSDKKISELEEKYATAKNKADEKLSKDKQLWDEISLLYSQIHKNELGIIEEPINEEVNKTDQEKDKKQENEVNPEDYINGPIEGQQPNEMENLQNQARDLTANVNSEFLEAIHWADEKNGNYSSVELIHIIKMQIK